MAKTFQFELVSPEHKVISEPMTYASIPGSEGEFGVLPGHASLIATLKAGIVELSPANTDATQRIFIAGGVADVSAENVTVLAEEAISVGALDQEALDGELKLLNEDLAITEDKIDQKRLKQKIEITKAKLNAIAA